MIAIRFTWSDAWLLLAIWHASDETGAVLKDVIGAGDWINHAIFAPGELKNGLARLTRAGYVAEECGRFRVIGRAGEFFESREGRTRAVMKQREALEAFLGLSGYPTGGKPEREDPRWAYPSLSLEAIEAAASAYRDRARRLPGGENPGKGA